MNKRTYLSLWSGDVLALQMHNCYSKHTQIQSVNYPNISGDSLAPILACCVPVLMQCHELLRLWSLLPLVQWLAFCLPNYATMIYNNNQSCYKAKSCPVMKVKSSQVSSHWTSSPSQVELFSLFSQASHKSLNLRLEAPPLQYSTLK